MMIQIHLGGGYGRPHQIFSRPWCLQVLFLVAVCEERELLVLDVGSVSPKPGLNSDSRFEGDFRDRESQQYTVRYLLPSSMDWRFTVSRISKACQGAAGRFTEAI